VGTQGGTIYKYNIQSGKSRGKYPPAAEKKQERKQRVAGDINRTIQALEKKFKVSNRKSDQDKEERNAVVEHDKERRRQAKLQQASHQDASVTGLAVDAVNKTLISVGDDAKLILWNFVTHAPHKRSPYMLPAPATKLSHVRDSDLAAIALNDFSVVLFDCSALQIVRRFGGDKQNHTAPITDMAFAPDGRSLYTSSLDRSIRVWDVPTNHCVDWLAFQTAPTSITVSPTGEFLATTHADRLGISMWSDRTFYQTVYLDTSKPPEEPAQMNDPVPIAETMEGIDASQRMAFEIEGAKELADEEEDSKVPPEQKAPGLATMSGLPPAHWKNLFHLELVKERNKPSVAPKKPPTAPFFLQWRGGEDTGPSPMDKAEEEKEPEDEWAAAWSDDDDGNDKDTKMVEVNDKKRIAASVDAAAPKSKKRRVVTHHRSHLASLLQQCHDENNGAYQSVTDHMATLGPSAIDISLSTLCNGMHDLHQGLPLLHKATQWLLQACESRERYEAIQAYLHRFLHLHAAVVAGIQEEEARHKPPPSDDDAEKEVAIAQERTQLLETIAKLRQVQAGDGLKDKMQHSLCLLRHFLRMV
jgi:U3 small nucleolar RNA-associated protein 21